MDNDDASIAFSYEVAADKMRNQLKFLLSKLVYTISRESHPIAFLFEDLHWADNDALGKNYLTDLLFYHLIGYTSYIHKFLDRDYANNHDGQE